jgi:hypothetical protein
MDHRARGKDFQVLAAELISRHFGVDFGLEGHFLIGSPPKGHKFDLVSRKRDIVGETKNITWTVTGNSPSAKLAFVNEAVLYLTLLGTGLKRFIVLPRATHPRKPETLAEYYFRTYRHLLGGIQVFELDAQNRSLRELTAESKRADIA